MKDVGWIPAGELSSGDPVKLRSDEYVPIESYDVIILDEPIKVYNFEVEDNHNYYVSENEVLVHNGYYRDGSYGYLKKKAKSGEEVHHLPQQAYNRTIGRSRNTGPAIIMSKADHKLTRTYAGRGRKTMKLDRGLNARQRMAREIIGIRREHGKKYNSQLLTAIKYSKGLAEYQK